MRIILKVEVSRLKKELAEKELQLQVKPSEKEKPADDELSWLNILSRETSENVQERINLQKALFELEETNIRNRIELQHLDDAIAKQHVSYLLYFTILMVIVLVEN
jgi:kinesin family member 18/19